MARIVHQHTAARVIYRFFSGRPLDGVRRTSCTFLHAGRDLTDHGHASPWASHPGWKRAACRVAGLIVALGILYGRATSPALTDRCIVAAAASGLVIVAWRGSFRVLEWRHYRRLVLPLHRTVAPLLEVPRATHPKKYISIPRDYMTDERTRVKITLPEDWLASDRMMREVGQLVSRRLKGQWDMSAYHDVHPPYAEWRHAPQPPARVSFADIRAAMDASPMNKIVIGIGAHNEVHSIDLDSEAPHIALSMPTGGGKSALLRMIIAFLINHGCDWVGIIDPKSLSHNWASTLPRTHIFRTAEAQMKAIHDFREEMDRRYREVGESEEEFNFPRRVLIIEECNSWVDNMRDFWEDYRSSLTSAERSKVPKHCPAIRDLKHVLSRGRQCNMNIIAVFQRMSANAVGGADLRANFGAKILARFDVATWRMLIGTSPVPRSSTVPGRAISVIGEDQVVVQMAFLTTAEAKAYAFAGESVPEPTPGATIIDMPVAVGAEADRFTLREAADAEVIPIKYAALRKARQRDRSFPSGVMTGIGRAYTAEELQLWAGNRARTAKAA